MRQPLAILLALTLSAALAAAPLAASAQPASASGGEGASGASGGSGGSGDSGGGGTFAEPSIVNPAWSLDLTVSNPRAISVADRSGRTAWYWYLPYKVVNNTGADRLFIPEITIINEHGEIVTAGRRIPQAVFPAIAARLGNPLLESPGDVLGTLLQGEDFAKQSVAIWAVSSLDVDRFTVFFAGADGETTELRSPSTGEVLMQAAVDPITGEPVLDAEGEAVMRPVMVRRTRAFTFAVPGTPGDVGTPRDQPVELIASYEVMR